MMRRIPRRLWKWIHLGSYVLLPLGIVHGITAGTDSGSSWYQLISGGLIGLLAFLTAVTSYQAAVPLAPMIKCIPGRLHLNPPLALIRSNVRVAGPVFARPS